MPKTIYDKPVRALMKDMVADWALQPGEVFTTLRAIQWFETRYPKIRPTTVQAHLVQAATNDPGRLHHPATNGTDDLLFKVTKGQFRLYEPGRDPAPIHEKFQGDIDHQVSEADHQEQEVEDVGPSGGSEFLLEKDLQRYLAENLHVVEPGLQLYEEEGVSGLEFDAGGRRIDILATDNSGRFVVLELKVSRGYDRVIGQLLRYMNWVRKTLANGKQVRGLVICRSISEDLRLACADIQNVELLEYQLSVTVSKVAKVDLSGKARPQGASSWGVTQV